MICHVPHVHVDVPSTAQASGTEKIIIKKEKPVPFVSAETLVGALTETVPSLWHLWAGLAS